MLKTPKILLVDDDVLILNLAKVLFESIACPDVSVASGSEDGLKIFQEKGADYFELIILDLQMPGIDGVQFIRILAQAGYTGALAILSSAALNVLHTVESLASAHRINVLRSIKKPLTKDGLSGLIMHYEENCLARMNIHSPESSVITAKDIEMGMENNEFFLVFQPKVSAQDRYLVGVEALCRWVHPLKGFIPPNIFIPLAEESGLIAQLTKFVIKSAITQIKRIHAQGFPIHICINVSTSDLEQLDFPEFVMRTALNSGLSHEYIILEVTESRLAENIINSLEVFVRLSLQGIKLSIDDFGTGYSSQEKLKTLPFYELKIDQSFSNNVHLDPHLQAIVASNILLARNLGLQTTVEGIETTEDFKYVADLGCNVIQGYFIARPMKMDDLITWALNWREVCEKTSLA